MKIAIMQPYFFPYIGYFQLINAADKFIIYDDVNFIKQGWINRNYILLNNKPYLFSIPLSNLSSYRIISEVEICAKLFNNWKRKFIKNIEQAYFRSPNYDIIINLIKSILSCEENKISTFVSNSIISICNYLDINTIIQETSNIYANTTLKGQERIIDICMKEKATIYINPIGGINLYSKSDFNNYSIELSFLKPNANDIVYNQENANFLPNLSILHILMLKSKVEIKKMLKYYEII